MRLQRGATFLLSTLLSACAIDRSVPTEVSTTPPDHLFTLVATPTLTVAQASFLTSVKARATSLEVHVARLRSAPELVLQRSNAVVFPMSPTRQFVAVGEQMTRRAALDISWAGHIQNEPGGFVQLVLTSKGVTGTVRTHSLNFLIEPIGGGLHALSRVGNFPPDD